MRSLVFVLFFLLFANDYFLHSQCHIDDFNALKALYESTDGDNWTDNTGWEIVAENDSPPAGCNLSSLHGIGLNGLDRVAFFSAE